MLNSQSLFVDTEYKADCMNKINYTDVIKNRECTFEGSILTMNNASSNEKCLNRTKKLTINENNETTDDTIKKIIKEY